MAVEKSLARQINEKILELLQKDPELKKAVRKWYFGEPVKPSAGAFPYVISTWLRSPAGPGTHHKTEYHLRFLVSIIDRSEDEDEAEKFAMDYGEHIEEILKANVTLDELVPASWISSIGPIPEGLLLKTTASIRGDYAVSGSSVELTCRVLRA